MCALPEGVLGEQSAGDYASAASTAGALGSAAQSNGGASAGVEWGDMSAVTIRDFHPDDLDSLYEVCLLTGDAGEDASQLVTNPRLLGDIYVGPYLLQAPELALVADAGQRGSGYALAVLDTAEFEQTLDEVWWPTVQARYLPTERHSATRPFDDELLALVRNPELTRHPTLPGYPSHLHVDLLEHIRGKGVGSRMLKMLFERLRLAGSPGVHLGVDAANEGAQQFYRHLGFVELLRTDGELYLGLSWPSAIA